MAERLAYHYTSAEKIPLILDSKVLQPSTNWRIKSRKFGIPHTQPYTHALPDHPMHYGWTTTGLLSFLASSDFVIEFALEKTQGVMVREAYYLTPDYMIQQSGENYWHAIDHGMSWDEFYKQKPYQNYILSGVPIRNYENDFLVPEIMYPYPVFLHNLRILPKEEIIAWPQHIPFITFPVEHVAELNT